MSYEQRFMHFGSKLDSATKKKNIYVNSKNSIKNENEISFLSNSHPEFLQQVVMLYVISLPFAVFLDGFVLKTSLFEGNDFPYSFVAVKNVS